MPSRERASNSSGSSGWDGSGSTKSKAGWLLVAQGHPSGQAREVCDCGGQHSLSGDTVESIAKIKLNQNLTRCSLVASDPSADNVDGRLCA